MYKLGHNSFELTARGTASPEVQIEYLQKLQKVHMNEIETLKVQLGTIKLENQLQKSELFKQIDALQITIRTLMKSHGLSLVGVQLPKKNTWWKFWGKK